MKKKNEQNNQYKNRIGLYVEESDNEDLISNQPSYYKKSNHRNRLLIFWLFIALLIIGSIGFAVWYQFYRDKSKSSELFGSNKIFKNETEFLIDQPYVPLGSTNIELAKCINLYNDRFFQQSLIACREFVEKPSTEEERSLAYTVLGILNDDAGRFVLAIENLEKALKLNPNNKYAYYNLVRSYKHSGRLVDARMTALTLKKVAPNDPRVALLVGNLFNELNESGKAIDVYQEGLSTAPNNEFLTFNLALSYYKQGDIPLAVENFERAILLDQSGSVAIQSHAYLGSIYYDRNELDKAEHHFRNAVRLSPNDSKYLYNLAVVLKNNFKKEEALKYLEKSLDANSSDVKVYQLISGLYLELEQFELAIRALKKAISFKPNDLDSLFQLSELYYKKGDYTQAEEVYRQIISLTPGDTYTEMASINLAVLLDEMERYGEAVSILENLIQINPNNEKAYYTMGMVYKHMGKGSSAIEYWRKAMAINPASIKNLEAVADYMYENGFYNEAVSNYQKVLDKDSNNFKILLKISDCYAKTKNYSSAEKVLLHVLNKSNSQLDLKIAHRQLAVVYSESQDPNLQKKAKEEIYRSVHIDPNDWEGRLTLSKILINSGSLIDREKAIDELLMITRSDLNPKLLASAYNYLGICYFKNGEYKLAMKHFQNALDLDSEFTEAYQNKKAASASWEKSVEKNTFL